MSFNHENENTSPPLVTFEKVARAFSGRPVLRSIDLDVRRGEIMFIIGTSGVGKSVTIKHLIGLLRPDSGRITFDGREVQNLTERQYNDLRKRCAMVFQHSTLLDALNVLENVALPLSKHRRLKGAALTDAALALLAQVNMESFAERRPEELGDGLKKRVAIARALALQPECMLFDEPTTGLSPVYARRVDALIRSLKRKHVTSIVVSHDLESIFGIADRISFIYQGTVRLCGTPEAFKTSDDPIVQQFICGNSDGLMETPGF